MADDQDDKGIVVVIRIRPLSQKEIDAQESIAWQYSKTTIIETRLTGEKHYVYDHILGPATMNPQMYDVVARKLVVDSLNGYNGTVFTYGQTGSGKTHSMMGVPSDPGIIRQSISTVFASSTGCSASTSRCMPATDAAVFSRIAQPLAYRSRCAWMEAPLRSRSDPNAAISCR